MEEPSQSASVERRLFENRVQLTLDDLLHHGYIVGASGTGKTVFLMNVLKSLVEKHGDEVNIQVIDPHGDLAWNKQEKESPDLAKILPNIDQIILLDADIEFSLNPLQLPVHNRSDSREHSQVVSWQIDLLTNIFEEMFRVTELRAPRLMFILTSCLRYLYALRDDPTFIDFYDLLLKFNQKDEMAKILSVLKIDRTEVMETIQFLADMHNKEMYMSVLNKVQQFATDTYLRQVFSARKRTVDFMELTKPGKVVLWRLGVNLTKAVKPALMAAIMMNIWAAIQYRERLLLPRTPIICVIDEFQHLQWMNILKTILSEARKFRLGLILAHQNSEQLSDELLSAIWGNVWMKVIFSISGIDADRLAKNFDATRTKEVIASLTSIPAFSCDIQTKSRGKELRSPLVRVNLAERLPPPKLVRRDEDVQALIESMKAAYGGGIVEPSMFETFELGGTTDPYFRYPALKPIEYLMLQVLNSYERLPYDAKWRDDVSTLVSAMKGYGFDCSRFPLALDSLSRRGLVTSREEYIDYRERKVINGKAQNILRRPQSEAEKNDSRVMTYAVSKKARLDFFEDLPKGARGGDPLHTYLLNVALKKYRSSGYFCFVDRGDKQQKLPDIIAVPYTEVEHDGVWKVDPDLWNQVGTLAVEVEAWPGKHRDRVERNYKKSSQKVRQVVFVTDSEYNKEKVESALRGIGASKCQIEMVQDVPGMVLSQSKDESESDRDEDFPMQAEEEGKKADAKEEDRPKPIQLMEPPLNPIQYEALKVLKMRGSMDGGQLADQLIAKGFTKTQVNKALGDYGLAAYMGVSADGSKSILTPSGSDLLDTIVDDGNPKKTLTNQVFTGLLNEDGACPLIDKYNLPDHPEIVLYRAKRGKHPFNPEEWDGKPELILITTGNVEGFLDKVSKYVALGHKARVITDADESAGKVREALASSSLNVHVEVHKGPPAEEIKPREVTCPLCETKFSPVGTAKCPGCGSLVETEA